MPETTPAPLSDEPYPGLRSFRRDETHIFFGREGTTNTMVDRLAARRFLAVTGASGSGKSSLVRTGLLDALDRGLLAQAGAGWLVADFRPGGQPLAALAAAVGDVLAEAAGEAYGPERLAVAQAQLARGPLGLVEWLGAAGLPPGASLLLLVDQFEEIFRYRRSDEADAFVALLLGSVRQRQLPIYAVITMRSDFLGECARFEGLAEAINDSQFLAPRLTRPQLREAIEGPATVYGGRVEPALVNRLLNDSGANPDQLPLLSHVLMLLWQNAPDAPGQARVLTLAAYESLGGLEGALSNHADRVLAGLTPPQQHFAQSVFRALVESEGTLGRDVRRPLPLRELATVAGVAPRQLAPVVEAFRAPGRNFLTPPSPAPLAPDTVIDISHESLIRQWARLRDWVREEFASAVTWRDLAARAALWKAGHEGRLRMPYLGMLLRWRDKQAPNAAWAARYGGDFALADRFLDSSRTMRSLRRGGLAASVVLLLGGSLGFAWFQYSLAEASRRAAVESSRAAAASRAELRAQRERSELLRLQSELSGVRERPGAPDMEAAAGRSEPRQGAPQGPAQAATPGLPAGPTLPGGNVLTIGAMPALLEQTPTPLLIDVWAEEASAHAQSIPASIRMPFAGDDDDAAQARLVRRLGNLTGENRQHALVFFCQGPACREARTAAARAIEAGYANVFWYAGGIQEWRDRKFGTSSIQQQAGRLTEMLEDVQAMPPQWRWAMAATLSETVPVLLEARSDTASTLAAARRGAEMLDRLAATPAFQHDPQFLFDQAEAHRKLGQVHGVMNTPDRAIAEYARSVEIRLDLEQLAPRDLDAVIGLANARLQLGRAMNRNGQVEQGLKEFERAVAGLDAMTQRTGIDLFGARAVVFREGFDALLDAGRRPEALAAILAAEAADVRSAEQRGAVERVENNLWTDRVRIAWMREGDGQLEQAAATYQAASARLDEVSATRPGVASWHANRAEGRRRASNVLRRMGRLQQSLEQSLLAIDAAEAAWAIAPSNDSKQTAQTAYLEIVRQLGGLSWAMDVAGDFPGALAAADAALARIPALVWIEGNRAHALMFLGRVDEARDIYLRRRGRFNFNGRKWDDDIREDFAELRNAGHDAPLMAEVEAQLLPPPPKP